MELACLNEENLGYNGRRRGQGGRQRPDEPHFLAGLSLNAGTMVCKVEMASGVGTLADNWPHLP